jgi:type 1 glutamine amidotransferase
MLVVNKVSPYRDGPAGVHEVLPQAADSLSDLARQAGLEPAVISDVGALNPEDLAAASVVALFNIGETPWTTAQRAALSGSVTSGRTAVLGVHSATDACRDWDDYGSLLGARFDGHPWTTTFDIDVVDPGHPSTAHLPAPWRWRDEVYLFSGLRPDARVLLRADPGGLDMSVGGARIPPHGLPLAWCHRFGSGRALYTALGHFPAAWESPVYRRHLAGALEWLLGD